MFNTAAVDAIYRDNRETLSRVLALEKELNGRFYGLEAAVRCMMLSAMTGEAMVMIGPPGTAKSRLIRAFCSLIGVLDRDPREMPAAAGAGGKVRSGTYFEYLLTQFTEPSELFGYFDLAKLMGANPALERITVGQMQEAEVVFLDEVFNASSAILNALLTFMNERKFHDRGVVHDARMKLLFAATNHPPREEGLGAVFDRFLLRCRVENVRAGHEHMARLLRSAWTETHSHADVRKGDFRDLPDRLAAYRDAIETATTQDRLAIDGASPVVAQLSALVAMVRARELSEMSNRRLVKFSAIVLAQAMLRAADAGAATAALVPRDLLVLLDYGLDQDEPGHVEKIRQDLLLA